jgi:hypothetical protein
MISGILSDILAYILFTSFILCFLGGCVYLIIYGIREYLEEANGFFIFATVLGCFGVTIVAIIILGVFGL